MRSRSAWVYLFRYFTYWTVAGLGAKTYEVVQNGEDGFWWVISISTISLSVCCWDMGRAYAPK